MDSLTPSTLLSPEPQSNATTGGVVVDLHRARIRRDLRRFAQEQPHLATFNAHPDRTPPGGAA